MAVVGDLRERGHLDNLGRGGSVILKWIFKKWDKAWVGLISFRIGTGGGLLLAR
jgi:hypothetical protein